MGTEGAGPRELPAALLLFTWPDSAAHYQRRLHFSGKKKQTNRVHALCMEARCPPGQPPCTQRPGPGASGQRAVTPGTWAPSRLVLASCRDLNEGRAALSIQRRDIYQNPSDWESVACCIPCPRGQEHKELQCCLVSQGPPASPQPGK